MDEHAHYAELDYVIGPEGIHYTADGHLSKFGFPSARNAMLYAMRPQRITADGLLVPDTRWSRELN